MEDEFSLLAETIGRTLLGRLTLTVADGERAKTDRLLGPGAFEGYSIVAFKFSSDRHPSDRIHENVVVNPGYPDRVRRTDRKAEDLHTLAREKNIEGIFELAMEDTDEYHSLVESSGVQVITDGMKKLQTRIRQEIRFWKTYIITGGTNVFVPCRDSDAERVKKLGDGLASGVEVLKVAGKAHRYINF